MIPELEMMFDAYMDENRGNALGRLLGFAKSEIIRLEKADGIKNAALNKYASSINWNESHDCYFWDQEPNGEHPRQIAVRALEGRE